MSSDRHRRRRRAPTEEQSLADDDMEADMPIDVLENTRNRTPREHVQDEAVGKEIEKR